VRTPLLNDDEASAWYAEFGPFYVGLQFSPEELPRYLEGQVPALKR
jgi:chlorite dismutase